MLFTIYTYIYSGEIKQKRTHIHHTSSSTTSSTHHHHHHTHIHHHKDGTHTQIHTEEGHNSDLLVTTSSTNTTAPTPTLGPTLPTILDTSLDEPMEVELGQLGHGTGTAGTGTGTGIYSKERVTNDDYSTVHPDLFRRRFVPKYEVYSGIYHSIIYMYVKLSLRFINIVLYFTKH